MDPSSPEFRKAVLDLRSRSLSLDPELQNQVRNALDPNYWRDLNSRVTVCGSGPGDAMEDESSDSSRVQRALETLSTQGYFQIPSLARRPAIERMRECLVAVRGAGWHPTFVFVYDEFWRAYRGNDLVRFLSGALGEGYRQLPYLWGHYVPAGAGGWRPHVDGPTPAYKLTVWIALGDATLENGCMYVVPRNRETENISDQFLTIERVELQDVRRLLQNAKALPAPAGSYLGWGPYLIHWGSTSSPQAVPRISVSAEFTVKPPDLPGDKRTLIDADPAAPLPSFQTRLRLVARAIQDYEAFDPEVFPYLPLAERIIAHLAAQENSGERR